MKNKISFEQIAPIIEEKLKSGDSVTITPTGFSMRPMLFGSKSTVTLSQPPQQLKKYDLPLYRRSNGEYVIHRVIKCCCNGTYTMCGDNQSTVETGIDHSQIIGVVTSFVRKTKSVSCSSAMYRLYCSFWVFIRPLRKYIYKAINFIRRHFNK